MSQPLEYFNQEGGNNKQKCDEVIQHINENNLEKLTFYDVPNDGNCGYAVMFLNLIFNKKFDRSFYGRVNNVINNTFIKEDNSFSNQINGIIVKSNKFTFYLQGKKNRIIWPGEKIYVNFKLEEQEYNLYFRVDSRLDTNNSSITFNEFKSDDISSIIPTISEEMIIENCTLIYKQINDETDIGIEGSATQYCEEDSNQKCFPVDILRYLRLLFPNVTPHIYASQTEFFTFSSSFYMNIPIILYYYSNNDSNSDFILNKPDTSNVTGDESIIVAHVDNHFFLLANKSHKNLYTRIISKVPTGSWASEYCNRKMTFGELFNLLKNSYLTSDIIRCNQ